MRRDAQVLVWQPDIQRHVDKARRVAEKRIDPELEQPMRKTISGLIGLISCALVFTLVYILWRAGWGSFFWLWDHYYYFRLFFFLCSCAGFYYLGRWSERERHRK
jgi:hypothetical protein